jgi:hypothetical protein
MNEGFTESSFQTPPRGNRYSLLNNIINNEGIDDSSLGSNIMDPLQNLPK